MEKKYYVFDKAYRHVEFDSYDELLGFLSTQPAYNWCYYIDKDLYEYTHKDYFLYIKKECWYDVYNGDLDLIPNERLCKDIRLYTRRENKAKYRARENWIHFSYKANYLGFRNGPVPTTGKWGYMHCYSSPKTMQCIRDSKLYPEYTRGKRKYLPTAWDDVHRSDLRCRSWKNRKVRRQWM